MNPVFAILETAPNAGTTAAGIVFQTIWLLAVVLIPFVVFALIIHWLEQRIQLRLASRFGWSSVLWTGWLGTPVHELSHALFCLVFRHRINEIALFKPDLKSGRLGYVDHSFTRGNWFEELGNFFIGIAPLIGGSVVLTALLWCFYPDAATEILSIARGTEAVAPEDSMVGIISDLTMSLIRTIAAPANWLTWRFWIFMYLVLCVGGHMAPSASDYDGAGRGVTMVAIILIACGLLVSLLGFETDELLRSLLAMLTPVIAVLSLTIAICFLATAVVFAITVPFKVRWHYS